LACDHATRSRTALTLGSGPSFCGFFTTART
jgi:hypothetical protein